MNSRDLVDLCFRNLLRRRTRTLLAVIGVVVGTCAIVVMMSIGFGLTDSYKEQIESYGNLHMITVMSNGDGAVMQKMKDAKGVINDKAINDMEKMKGVGAVTPVISENLVIGVGKKVAQTQVLGVRPEVLEKFNYKVLEGGRLLNSGDKYEILFGNQVPTWFQDPNSDQWSGEPLDVMSAKKMIVTGDDTYGQKKQNTGEKTDSDKVVYKQYDTRAIGVLENPDDDSAYCAYMNITALEDIAKELKKARKESTYSSGTKTYDEALVYVSDINDSAEISKQLRDQGYQTSSPSDWLESMKETAKMIQGILGGIGGISLLVAALGITNTMIMSIYERTKEIGVMKVIGANLRDIRKMFLLEAGLIGFIGGFVGLIFSFIVSLLMNTVLKDIISIALGSFGGGTGSAISRIPIWLAVAAVAFATGIGLMAGYYPAKRAMNLSALESLKNE
ncbi:ABC transporter permease [Aminipila terrae]|uniref:FtsX-like permease family protein n=1 Tax=Aminipila terrae TaxID=2697030 RepID=A0A6P1MDP5_9FIRM|nr:FtsX-like permease family protein [Aminipila terrae]QHI72027.1 FtsX-like permease family protein [Aminipila terrae]